LIDRLLAHAAGLTREDGQGVAEYALIVSTVSIGAVAVFTPLGTAISNAFNSALGAF
jgi:Flp pilus assembly pilin Flp